MDKHGSINRIYRLVWDRVRGLWQVAPETARGQGKCSGVVGSRVAVVGHGTTRVRCGGTLSALGQSLWRAGLFSAGMVALNAHALDAGALPTGGQVKAGQAVIGQQGRTMTVTQGSDRAIINWQGFDIGREASVQFKQPGAQSATLNRVVGGQASQIMGALNANGQVYVINGAGVLFGKGAQVNVGGLVASTLDMSNGDFLAGRDRFVQGSGTGEVVNEGTIRSKQGGKVALVGAKVSNTGTIVADQGDVVLAAGRQVEFTAGANGRLKIAVDASEAATLVKNGGVVAADGGQVVLTAKGANALAAAVVSNTGTVQARTMAQKEGRILLLADMDKGGRVEVAGRLDASAPVQGNGGFVETSAAWINVAADTQVTTLSSTGKTGKWVIDPTDLVVSAGAAPKTESGIGATTLQSNLNSTNVSLVTVESGTGRGHIRVEAPVSWSGNTTLSLQAHGDVRIEAPITATGANARVEIYHGGVRPISEPPTSLTPDADYYVNAPITLSGANSTFAVNGDEYTMVRSGADLMAMGTGAGNRYALAQDLNISNIVSMRSLVAEHTAFEGTFAGLGHTISNLNIQYTGGGEPLGMFGSTGSGAVLRDFRLSRVSVLNDGSGAGTGALVGLHAGTASNVHVDGVVRSTWDNAGGLVGNLQGGTVRDASSTGTVEGSMHVGGMVGLMTGGLLTGSWSSAAVTSERPAVGGLVGGMQAGTLTDSYATGVVRGIADVGGLIGDMSGGTVANAYARGNVFGRIRVGGLMGMQRGSTVQDSWAQNKVTGVDQVGGLIGEMRGDARLLGTNYAVTDVSGELDVGGLVGRILEGEIRGGYAEGIVRGIRNVGGLIGVLAGSGTTVRSTYSTAALLGSENVGGLIGLMSDGAVDKAYATGTVVGDLGVGGLIGNQAAGAASNVWASGRTHGVDRVGGLVGELQAFGVVMNAHWDSASSGKANAFGGGLGEQLNVSAVDAWNTYSRSSYGHLGTWQETAANSRVWVTNASGQDNWVIFEGASRPFLMSELSTTIKNAHQLQLMVLDLNGDYVLHNDIDASATRLGGSGMWSSGGFVHVGNLQATFGGTLDGQGHVVRDLFIEHTQSGVGLIGSSAESAIIQNVGLINVDITGTSFVGGLVGEFRGTLANSYVQGRVKGWVNVGGIAGTTFRANLDNVYMDGQVVGTFTNVGGLLGRSALTTLNNGYAVGSVSGRTVIGGLVGFAYDRSDINHAHAANVVSGTSSVGGLIGDLFHDATVGQDVHWSSSVSGTASAVGAGGTSFDPTNVAGNDFSHSAYGKLGTWAETAQGSKVWVATNADGVKQWVMLEGSTRPFLYSEYSTTIHNAHQLQLIEMDLGARYTLANDVNASMTNAPGSMWSEAGFSPLGRGLAGVSQFTGVLDGNYHVVHDLHIDRGRETRVGLIGLASINSMIRNIGMEGGTVVGASVVGPLVAFNEGQISQSYAAMDTRAEEYAGGLVGFNRGDIDQSFSQGTLYVEKNFAGGLVGGHAAGNINQSYSSTRVSGSSDSLRHGFLVGAGDGGVVHSYYGNTDAQGNPLNLDGTVSPGAGSGLSYAELGAADSFVGWNVDDTSLSGEDSFEGWDTHVTRGTRTTRRTYEGGPLLQGFLKTGYVIALAGGSKVYDGTVGAADVDYILSTSPAGEGMSFQVLGSANVGLKNLGVTLAQGQSGYKLFQRMGTYSITPKTITVTGVSGQSIYGDGVNLGAGFTADGLVAGEGVDVLTGLSVNQLIGSTTNAGDHTLTVQGALGTHGNYDVVALNDGTWRVNRKQITVTANGGQSVYGDAASVNPGFTADGLVNGQTVAVLTNLANSFGIDSNTNAGAYTLTMQGALGAHGNYDVVALNDGTWRVNRKQITVTANGGQSVYGDAASVNPGFTADGLVNGQTVAVLPNLANSFGIDSNTNAAAHTLTVQGALGAHGNYDVVALNDGTWRVNRKQITVTANGGQSVYGDAPSVNPGFTADGLVNGQTVAVLTNLANSFGIDSNTNAGAHTLTVQGALGTHGNYDVVALNDGTWIVNRKQITVTANGGQSVYGDAASVNPGFTADGLVNGQTVAVLTNLANSFGIDSNTNAGAYTLTMQGALGAHGNYDVVALNDGTWTVNRKRITVRANNGESVYGDVPLVNPGFTAEGLVNGQTESELAGLSNDFAVTPTTGAGNQILSVHGALAADSNYEIIRRIDGTWLVRRKALLVSANDAMQVEGSIFDGASGVRYAGFVNGEDASVLGGRVTYGGAAPLARESGRYGIEVSGLRSDNYDIQYQAGVLTVSAMPPNEATQPPGTSQPPVNTLPPDGIPSSQSDDESLQDDAPAGSDLIRTAAGVCAAVADDLGRDASEQFEPRANVNRGCSTRWRDPLTEPSLGAQEPTARIGIVQGSNPAVHLPLVAAPSFIAR